MRNANFLQQEKNKSEELIRQFQLFRDSINKAHKKNLLVLQDRFIKERDSSNHKYQTLQNKRILN